jgi:hypothetical protein
MWNGSKGPDTVGEHWARQNGIKVSRFPANWKLYKGAAGPIRNQQMGDYADGGIIMWDGKSKGQTHVGSIKETK